MRCVIHHSGTTSGRCHIYSLPFRFTCLEKISNQFPTIVFNTVTYLHAFDTIPMQHEFFMRMSQVFPFLKHFSVSNLIPRSSNYYEWKSDENPYCSFIEYSHLSSLDLTCVHKDYVVQFLLETKTHLPCLTDLYVDSHQLRSVTMNFTRN
ncbi:unnamed protein product [Rotaria magnacalcarata]